MRKIICLLILTSLISGCASKETSETVFNKANDFGVLAFFSQNLSIQFNPFSSKNRKHENTDIQSWNMPLLMTTEMENELKTRNKRVKPVLIDPATVRAGIQEARNLNEVYLGDRYQILDEYLLSEADKQNIKYLFVLHPISLDAFQNYKGGFGFICNSSQNAQGDLEGYALLRAELWNVEKRDVVRRVTITPADMTFKTGMNCQESRRMAPAKLAQIYKAQVLNLAKKSVELVIQRATSP